MGMANAGTGGIAASAGNAGQLGVAGAAAGGLGGGGASSAGAANGGSAGATGGAAPGGAGVGGSAGSNGQVAGGGAGGGADTFPTADCAPGAIFCDDFEDYPVAPAFDDMGNLRDFIKTGDTMPTWLAYHFHGPPYVVTANPFKGAQAYHLDTETGHIAAADIIKESPDGADLLPAAHYGRVMLNFKNVPPMAPFGLLSENGLLPGSTTETAQFTLGGVNGKLAFMYTQRTRIYKNDVSMPEMRRGGNDEMGDPGPNVQCTVAATTETITPGTWVCVEWMMDRETSEMHLWLDGVAQTEVDVAGGAGATCGIGTAATWQGPEHFTELVLGFEMYGNDSNAGAWEASYDEFAVGRERLGCPTP